MPEERIIPPESFATARLILRKPRAEDTALIFATYAQDPEVTRYLTFFPHRDLKDTHEAFERFLENWRSGKSYSWLIFRRDREELIGAISAREDQGINLGYLLARPFWGQGFMSEALSAIVEWAFSVPSTFRVWAVCDLENDASARLLERNGFRQEGVLKRWSLHPNVSDVPRDCFCYAKTRDEMIAFRTRSPQRDVINFPGQPNVIMSRNTFLRSALILLGALLAVSASASDDYPLFHSTNPLAPRDEWGVLHQMPNVDPTDYFHRSGSRLYYYFKSRHELLRDPAYVASLQVVLRNRGYYCGPIDGITSDAVSEAIARAQKNHVQRVTGTLTIPVRRALNLP